MMLSKRGQGYAQSGLSSGWKREKKPYNKASCPTGEVSFLNAETFLMHEEILEYINNHHIFDEKCLTYNEGPMGTLRLRQAMASHVNDYFSPSSPVKAEETTITAGVTGLNEMTIFSLTDEGEGVLLGRPIYGSFYGDMSTKTASKLVYASFEGIDQFSPAVVDKYEAALIQAQKDGIKIRVLVICNPHNPLGQCYPIETLKALMGFCEKYQLHLVSDEIYALSLFDIEGEKRTEFASVISVNTAGVIDPGRVHALYGLSTGLGLSGLRIGCLITRNEELTLATRSIGRFNWPSELSVAMATTVLEDKHFVNKFLRISRDRLGKAYKFATDILDNAGIDYIRGGNAGFFLWLDLSPFLSSKIPNAAGWEAEADFKKKLSEASIEMTSGFKYKSEEPGWFRVIFTVDQDVLGEGLRRIIEVTKKEGK